VVGRLHLRRFLLPSFSLTFSRRDSLELAPEDLVLLLRDPKRFEDTKRLKSAGGAPKSTKQLELVTGAPSGDNNGQED
jgi:hypothetical protein